MSDLIESRISEIRERLAKRTPGEWEMIEPDQNNPIIIARVDDGSSSTSRVVLGVDGGIVGWEEGRWLITEADHALITHAPSDLEALLAEREGMKAEIERLREDVSEKHPQISDTLHRQMPCGEVDAANRANGTASVGLPHSAEVAASHSCPICGRIAPEHDVGCPVDLYVRRLSAPLDPSSAPSETPELEREGVRCAKCQPWHSGIGNDDRETDLCEDCWRSPDREAGSGTDDAGTCIVDGGSETLHCLTHGVSFERGGGDRIPETCRETTWRPPRASSHPVPSEGGGE